MIRLALLVTLLGGCFIQNDSSSCKDVGCTALFAMVTVTVVDGANQPIDGLMTTTTNLSSGARVPTSDGSAFGSGVYVVVDDNFLGQPRAGTDAHTLLFTAQGSAGSVSAEYLIRAGECDCHVDKLTGPATLVLTD